MHTKCLGIYTGGRDASNRSENLSWTSWQVWKLPISRVGMTVVSQIVQVRRIRPASILTVMFGRATCFLLIEHKSPLGCATPLPVKSFQIFGGWKIFLKSGRIFTGISVAQVSVPSYYFRKQRRVTTNIFIGKPRDIYRRSLKIATWYGHLRDTFAGKNLTTFQKYFSPPENLKSFYRQKCRAT